MARRAREAKKSSTREPDQNDIDKLKEIRADLHDRHALFLKLTVGNAPGIQLFRWVGPE